MSTHVDTACENSPLSQEAARHLTDAIKLTVNMLHVLVQRAHVGKAHLALGYERWADYVATEFDMSRTRSYQLLGQHEVITVLSEAAGTDVTDVISEKAARDVKPQLKTVAAAIAARSPSMWTTARCWRWLPRC